METFFKKLFNTFQADINASRATKHTFFYAACVMAVCCLLTSLLGDPSQLTGGYRIAATALQVITAPALLAQRALFWIDPEPERSRGGQSGLGMSLVVLFYGIIFVYCCFFGWLTVRVLRMVRK
jgi:hypothetical protein